jgi:hypothetical protein
MSERGAVVCREEILKELERKADDLHTRAAERSSMFVALDKDQMTATRDILAAFPRLVGELSERNRADPFVIALARVRRLTVVSEERGGNERRTRIPLVCEHFGVPGAPPSSASGSTHQRSRSAGALRKSGCRVSSAKRRNDRG